MDFIQSIRDAQADNVANALAAFGVTSAPDLAATFADAPADLGQGSRRPPPVERTPMGSELIRALTRR